VIQCKLAVKAEGKLTQNENGQKIRCDANKDIAQLTVNQRQTTRDSSNACVCFYRSLKLLTDDHCDFVAA